MAREDLEVVAPAWSAFTRAVRNDPDAWNLTGDASIKNPGESKPYVTRLVLCMHARSCTPKWHSQAALQHMVTAAPGCPKTGAVASPC